MQSFQGLVTRIVNRFNAFGLEYMFTGALAASYYGTPRTTMDVDVIVHVTQSEVQSKLIPALKAVRLEVEVERIEAALGSGFRIVTARDEESPFSVDVILSREKLERRVGSILGIPTYYQTPEALVLTRLGMIKATVPLERAYKDEDDVRGILRFTTVDMSAVKNGAELDGTATILERMLRPSTRTS